MGSWIFTNLHTVGLHNLFVYYRAVPIYLTIKTLHYIHTYIKYHVLRLNWCISYFLVLVASLKDGSRFEPYSWWPVCKHVLSVYFHSPQKKIAVLVGETTMSYKSCRAVMADWVKHWTSDGSSSAIIKLTMLDCWVMPLILNSCSFVLFY